MVVDTDGGYLDAGRCCVAVTRKEKYNNKIMLQPEEIRRILSRHQPRYIDRPEWRRAAVLMPIFWNAGEPHVVFTKRSEHVPHHKGQVSFPGGSIEASDSDAFAAAVRETAEEIGLPPGVIEPLGRLDDILTITHFIVTPFVAQIPKGFPYRPNLFEIAEIFDVPLRTLSDPAHLREETVQWEGHPYPIYYFDHGGYNIWGATGKILRQFLAITGVLPGRVEPDDRLPADF